MRKTFPILSSFQFSSHQLIKILFAFIDQGTFSVANFLCNILLARWLSEQEYGAFSIAFSIYLLVSTLQGALVLEPMSVFGPTEHGDSLQGYMEDQLKLHLGINLSLVILLYALSFIFAPLLRGSIQAVAIILPFSFLVWFFRRSCYLKMQTMLATGISLIYAACLAIEIAALIYFHALHPWTVFFAFGLASATTSVWAIKKLNLQVWNKKFFAFSVNRTILRQNWVFGKWILFSLASDTILNMVYIPLLAIIISLEQAAGYRSVQNFLLPVQQLQAAITLMVIPWFSREANRIGSTGIRRDYLKILIYYLIPTSFYSFTLIMFCKPVVNFLYASEYYNSLSWLIPYLLLINLLSLVNLAATILLRVMKFSKPLLVSRLWSTAVVLSAGVVFVYFWHLPGVLISALLGVVVEGFILYKAVIPYFASRS
jgi:O-antigen/teichoic acid export membrane protein